MNVIIGNRYGAMLNTLQVDVIKRLDGEFTADEIIKQFQNLYFQRMILDITAIKDYNDLKNIQKISISLDMSKVILLLDDTPNSKDSRYLSKLIAMGIYNFTTNTQGIIYLYEHPNSYRDVAQYQQLDDVKEIVVDRFDPGSGTKIIGVKNLNQSAGATTFIYAMKKELSKAYQVGALEVGKRDFSVFRDNDMVSSIEAELGNTLAKMKDKEVVLIDMNNSQAAQGMCHEILYLLEPSTIKLNKMNIRILKDMKDKNIVLNQSMLTNKDVMEFEYEAKINVFYNMPPLDERAKDIVPMRELLIKMGFDKMINESSKTNKVLDMFGM